VSDLVFTSREFGETEKLRKEEEWAQAVDRVSKIVPYKMGR
jgi:hypothetical protein